MLQCHNDKDNVGIDEAARLQRQGTTLMDGAMDATMLTRWCYDKDKGDVDATMTRTTLKMMRLQGCNDQGNVDVLQAVKSVLIIYTMRFTVLFDIAYMSGLALRQAKRAAYTD